MKVKEIEGLIAFIAQSGLEEVKLETEEIKLSIKRNMPAPQPIISGLPSSSVLPTASPQDAPLSAAGADHESSQSKYVEFKAPMVGTFYQSPNPDAPPFVQVGDPIQKGQKLCVIEAMKLFNEIEADTSGTLVKVLVDDASPVEYDQPIFLIEPT